jgi:hypothetical protein
MRLRREPGPTGRRIRSTTRLIRIRISNKARIR